MTMRESNSKYLNIMNQPENREELNINGVLLYVL